MPPKGKKGKKNKDDGLFNSDDEDKYDLGKIAGDAPAEVVQPAKKQLPKKKQKPSVEATADSDADDSPPAKKGAPNKKTKQAEPREELNSDDDFESSAPTKQKKKGGSKRSNAKDFEIEYADEEEEPPAPVKKSSKKKAAKALTSEPAEDSGSEEIDSKNSKKGSKVSKKEDEEEEDTVKPSKKNTKKKGKARDFDDDFEDADEDLEKPVEAPVKKTKGKKGSSKSFELEEEAAHSDEPKAQASEDVMDLEYSKKSKKKKGPKSSVAEILPEPEAPVDEEPSTKTKKKKKKVVSFEPEPQDEELENDDQNEDDENAATPSSKGKVVETVADSPPLEDSLAGLSLDSVKKKKSKKKSKKADAEEKEVEQIVDDESSNAIRDADEPVHQVSKDGTFVNKSDHLTTTGTLLSHERSKDIQIDKFTVSAYGQLLVSDTSLNLLHGKRYGLVGANGSGKSTLLKALASGEVPIQSSVNVYMLEREFDPTELTAVEAVIDIVKSERDNLEAEMMELLGTVEGAQSSRLEYIHERLEELDLSSAAQKARAVLHGLGFTEEMQDMKTKDFSGGWRMRVALARALFVKPTVLLLDDATNHLDLSAVVWLEDYLVTYPHTIVLVSHSQDFLNTVCTDMMYLHNRKLDYFSGNYDVFVKVKEELDENAKKRAKADEKKMKKIKENLGRTGKQAKQAKSHEKAMLKRQEKDGVADIDLNNYRPERKLEFSFQQCGGGLPSPFLKFNDVWFHYPNRPDLYKKLNFGLDLKSRVALVGPNGAGKSTLMKLMTGELEPSKGNVDRHHHLKIARFHQHLTDQLDLSQSAIEWLCNQFPQVKPQDMRTNVGKFGLSGKSQLCAMEQLSDGQKRRVVFCWLSLKNAHLLMLDEPTNFLDLETIDSLAEAIHEFDGGVVLISHDFRLIDQVAEEIWVVEDGMVEVWEGDIREYKEHLKKKVTSQ